MAGQTVIYLCPKCFEVCEETAEEHRHRLLKCDPGEFGSERREPPRDRKGHIMTRAPRWYLEALGILPE